MNKQVSVLAAIAVLAIGLGVWLSQPSSKVNFEAGLLFEDLQEFANKLDSVEIENAQGVLLEAKKSNDSWLATVKPNQPAYPISQEKLAKLVETMMLAKLVEAKTSKPENYIRLGLQSIDVEDSMARLITFRANDQTWQVIVGNEASFGEGHYIIEPGDRQSWRTDKTISLPIDRFSWLKQPILPFEEQNIHSISRVDNFNWQITRTESDDFQLINKPKDKELEYDSVLNSVASNLITLKFEQLVSAEENFIQSLKVVTQLEVVATGDKIFQIIISELDDKYFVNFIASGPTEYWLEWYYQVSNFSAQQLIKTLDDFLAVQSTAKGSSDIEPNIVEEGDSPL